MHCFNQKVCAGNRDHELIKPFDFIKQEYPIEGHVRWNSKNYNEQRKLDQIIPTFLKKLTNSNMTRSLKNVLTIHRTMTTSKRGWKETEKHLLLWKTWRWKLFAFHVSLCEHQQNSAGNATPNKMHLPKMATDGLTWDSTTSDQFIIQNMNYSTKMHFTKPESSMASILENLNE